MQVMRRLGICKNLNNNYLRRRTPMGSFFVEGSDKLRKLKKYKPTKFKEKHQYMMKMQRTSLLLL